MSASTVGAATRKLNLESFDYQGLRWLHVEKPTKAEIEYLNQHFLFNPLNLEDVLVRHIRPKIDEYPGHLFIVLHFPIYDEESHAIISCEMDVFVGENYLVTINPTGRLRGLARFHQACQADEKLRKENMALGSGNLLYHILDGIVDRRLLLIDRIGISLEAVEEKIFCEKAQGVVKEISVLRRDIISFRRAVWPMREVICSLGTKIGRFSSVNLTGDFEEMGNQLGRIWDALNECKEIVEGLNDTYNAMATNRINDILRILTVVMAIGSILTVYVGFYGMNIPLGPLGGADPGGHPLAWIYTIVVGVVLAVIMIVYSIRKGWL